MRRELRHDDLDALAAAVSAAQVPPIFKAIETLSADVIGHRLFTIMHFDSKHGELERAYTSAPAVYPVGGRKKTRDTVWSDHVLRDRQVFRANTLEAIRAAFEDYATIASLGLGSVLNIPVLRTVARVTPAGALVR